VADGDESAGVALGEAGEGSEDGAHLVGPVEVGARTEEGDDGVDDDEARVVVAEHLVEGVEVVGKGDGEWLGVGDDPGAVGAEGVEARAEGVGEAVLGAEEEGAERGSAAAAGEGGAGRAGGGEGGGNPALALAGVAFEESDLAQGDVGMPEKRLGLRADVGEAAQAVREDVG
jgi:hypothetical protein